MSGDTSNELGAAELKRQLSSMLQLADEPQDWGIINADAERLDEFLAFLETRSLAPTQVYELIDLILASANERLRIDPSFDLRCVRNMLRSRPRESQVQRDYWASLAGREEFPIGAWLREDAT